MAGPIVTLADAKAHLDMPSALTSHDVEIQMMIDAAVPIVEDIIGPVVAESFTENYDGGAPYITLRKRPVQSVTTVIEYRGPVTWTLTQAASPAAASTYSYTLEADSGRIVRRITGGGTVPFYNGPGAVKVTYSAGHIVSGTIPANIRLAALELVRHNYQLTQQPGHPAFASTGMAEEAFYTPSGFAVPTRVIELLQSKRRAPSIA